jgi:signal transduction histidine kinase
MDKESKQIIISLLDEESTVTVQVTDNGSGISSTALPFIFERFYRVEQSRNKRTGGSGLGLAIAKQIIQGHGGSISAVSEIGEGTTVFFSLLKVKRSGEIR